MVDIFILPYSDVLDAHGAHHCEIKMAAGGSVLTAQGFSFGTGTEQSEMPPCIEKPTDLV